MKYLLDVKMLQVLNKLRHWTDGDFQKRNVAFLFEIPYFWRIFNQRDRQHLWWDPRE